MEAVSSEISEANRAQYIGTPPRMPYVDSQSQTQEDSMTLSPRRSPRIKRMREDMMHVDDYYEGSYKRVKISLPKNGIDLEP
jgi:hypothetical protein